MLDHPTLASALEAIRTRKAEVEQRLESLSAELKALTEVEDGLARLLVHEPAPAPAIRSARAHKPRETSFKRQLFAFIQSGEHGGRTMVQILRRFPDTKRGTLYATLSNLRAHPRS